MKKNVAGQLVSFEAYNITTGARVTGDAANITPYCQIDNAAYSPLGTSTVTEWTIAKSGVGLYNMQPSQAETNGSAITYLAISSTPNVLCRPQFITTVPPGFDIFLNAGGELSSPVVVGTNSDKTGYSLSASGITAIWDEVLEGARSARKFMRLLLSIAVGKVAGMASNHPQFRDPADTKTRVDALTTSDGDRTNVILDDS